MPPAFRLSYNPTFDGLRGVAILLVMGHHTPLPYFKGGFVGVDVFFVLSGFLITALLIKEFDLSGQIQFRSFYIRRALRLLPALVALLLILNLYTFLFTPAHTAWNTLSDSAVALVYLSNWVFAGGHASLYLTHTWSLAIEEQFYLLFPMLLVFLLRRLSRRGVLVVVVGLGLASCLWGLALLHTDARWLRIYYGLDTRLWELLLGGALAIGLSTSVYSRIKIWWAARRWLANAIAIAASLTIALLTLTVSGSPDNAPSAYGALVLASLATGLLILHLVLWEQSPFARILAWRPLVLLGQLSYSLYLWHVVLDIILDAQTGNRWIASNALALVVSALSYRFVEGPMLRLKARFQPLQNAKRPE